MARNAKTGSTKIFGGSTMPAGQYTISRALVCDETIEVNGESKTFDALYVEFKNSDGTDCVNALRLNGCWRPSVKSDGTTIARARGTFYDDLKAQMTGRSFDAVVEYINSKYVGKSVIIGYEDYVNIDGNPAHITLVNFVDPK